MDDDTRRFTLSTEDFALINPNTRTCPVFRTKADAELTKKIYRRVPVLVNERTGENPWGVSFMRMFNMSNDSHLFRTRRELEGEGLTLVGSRFVGGNEVWLPLYEAKMTSPFDHRAAHVVLSDTAAVRQGQPDRIDSLGHARFDELPVPRYWVDQKNAFTRLDGDRRQALLGFTDVTSPTNERTMLVALLPIAGVGHTFPLILSSQDNQSMTLLLANLNSVILDYLARQKMGGIHFTFFILKQLPILPSTAYGLNDSAFAVPRALELVYSAWDINPFVNDLWQEADQEMRRLLRRQWQENCNTTGGNNNTSPLSWVRVDPNAFPMTPFKWDEERRAVLRAELDAYYARLYGLTYDELRYILDPQDVYGPDFPGETFRVLKEKEMRQYGEYRTRRLVLEAWERLERG